jgi:hypothetical protein
MRYGGWYARHTARELIGRRVRTLREITTGMLSIPAGAELVIRRKFGGLDLRRDACACCGVAVWVLRVAPSAVELLPDSDAPR